ncbi:MAG: thiolase family protein [Alphaproteobacteria bacterium]
MFDDIYIIGVSVTPFGKHPEKSVKQLSETVCAQSLRDAQLSPEQIEAIWFSNTRQQMLEGQNTIRGQIALQDCCFNGVPIINVENACASGSSAVWSAVAYMAATGSNFTMAVGADKMFFPDKPDQMFAAFQGGTEVARVEENTKFLASIGRELIPAEEEVGASRRSFFMDVYGAFARQHMLKFGTTKEHFAAAAAKAHYHSTMNPLSQYQKNMSIEQVMTDKPIVYPFTRSMCAPISDGAAAAVLARGSALTAAQKERAVRLRSMAVTTATKRELTDYENHLGRRAALQAYGMAGISPSEIDVVELHDATAYAEIQQIENLGLCGVGEGGPYTLSGATTLGGEVVVNPCGGLMSKGHPVGATGIAQIHELVMQLRGEAGARQVKDAKLAVAENGGGFLHVEEAVTIVSVLSA